MKKNNFAKGFTLIELLVVIAIIGILAGIIYAPFQSARKKARDAKRVAEMKDITTALALYNDSNGQYPANLQVLKDTYGTDIPDNINLTSAVDMTKYNYSTYLEGSKVAGYHLYTHLEAPNTAISGAAKCAGAGSASYNCVGNVYTSNATAAAGVQLEPADVNTCAALYTLNNTNVCFTGNQNPANRSTFDTETSCKNSVGVCVLDYRGN